MESNGERTHELRIYRSKDANAYISICNFRGTYVMVERRPSYDRKDNKRIMPLLLGNKSELGGESRSNKLTCLCFSHRRAAGKKGRAKRRSSISTGIQTKSAGGEGGSAGRTRG